MRRALVYVVLLGALTGAVAGVALFGLPLLPGEGADAAPGALAGPLLERGLSVADVAVLVGALALLALLMAALVDLRRRGGRA